MAPLTSDRRPRGALPARWRRLLLTMHVLATVGVFGTDLVLLTLGASSLLGADPVTVYPTAHLIAAVVVQPLAVASLASGVALGLLTPWGLLHYWWTTIKLAITAVLSGVVVLVLVPRLATAADAATALAPHTVTAAEQVPLVAAPMVASLLLVLNVALAIAKPRWRLRPRADELGRRHVEYA